MTRWKCLSCGGEYDDIMPDGTLYFHVCDLKVKNPRDERVIDHGPKAHQIRRKGKGRKKVEE